MPKRDFDEQHHHQPRRTDKKKHHRRGFSEDIQDKRAARVGFKNYLRQVKEEELSSFDLDDLDEDGDDNY